MSNRGTSASSAWWLAVGLLVGCSGSSRDQTAAEEPGARAASETVTEDAADTLRVAAFSCTGGLPPDSGPSVRDSFIALPSGKPLHLQECLREGESFVRLTYQESILDGRYHVVRAGYYEGEGWVLLSDSTGWRYLAHGPPHPSPDNRFVAWWAHDLAGYVRNGVEVLEVRADSLVTVYEADGGDEWGVRTAEWETAERFVYWRAVFRGIVDGRAAYDSSRVGLQLRDGRWEQTPPEGS